MFANSFHSNTNIIILLVFIHRVAFMRARAYVTVKCFAAAAIVIINICIIISHARSTGRRFTLCILLFISIPFDVVLLDVKVIKI